MRFLRPGPAVRALSFLFSANHSKVGGQAIVEGVMMRSKEKISWAVRKKDGRVVTEQFPFVSVSSRIKVLGWPVMRGAVSLFEMLYWGIVAINRSAELYEDQPAAAALGARKRSFADSAAMALTIVIAFAVSIGLFLFLPMAILTLLGFQKSAVAFNILAGIMRVALLIGYLALISLWKDVRRLFEYHGAEHKAIFAFEDGKDLTLDNMRPYRTHHPRCGTSFLILVTVVCVFLFAVIDALLIRLVFGDGYTLPIRLGAHLLLIPLVGGVSFEVLKLSDRFRDNRLVRWLVAPGLWLQKITTREPDDAQMETAAAALKAAL